MIVNVASQFATSPTLAISAWVAVSMLSACSIPDEFACEHATQCVRDGVQGYCEPTKLCSFDDATCASRRRYADDVSGEQSDLCVPETLPLWLTTIGGPADDQASSLTIDVGGHPIVGGTFRGQTTGAVSASSRGDTDILLASLDGTTGTLRWSLDGGGSAHDELAAVSFAGGELLIGGSVIGAMSLGERDVGASGAGRNAFLARLTPSDSRATVDTLFASSGNADEFVAAASGNVWVGSYSGGQVVFSPGDTHPPHGALDIWAGAWAPTGNPDPIWSDSWGGTGVDRIAAAAVSLNQLVVVGAFERNLPVALADGTTSTLVSSGASDGFVMRMQASGAPNGRAVVMSAERFGGVDSDAIEDVLVTSDGSVVVTGTFAGSVSFGSGPVVARGTTDVFVHSRDTGRLWVAGGAGGAATSCCIAEAANGDVLVAGTFEGVLEIGDQTLQTRGMTDVFVARLTREGGVAWAASFGGPGVDVAAGVEVSAIDDVVVTATFADTAEVGGISVTANGGADWVVLAIRRH